MSTCGPRWWHDLKPEFSAVGVDFEERGALLDDALQVLDLAMGGADIERSAHGYQAAGVRYRPVLQGGYRPPVWVGGNPKATIRCAAHYERLGAISPEGSRELGARGHWRRSCRRRGSRV